jgi:sugar lactone lactonase YvrE
MARSAISNRSPNAEARASPFDRNGNVYLANGQIFVYDPAGGMIGEIDGPERPIDILFGGPDRRTLFMLGHHMLYEVKTRAPGEPFVWDK